MEQSGRFDGEGSDMRGDPMKMTTFVAAAFATLSFVASPGDLQVQGYPLSMGIKVRITTYFVD
jgi:hypothetical protein